MGREDEYGIGEDCELAVSVFDVEVHGLADDEEVYVCGSCPALGAWNMEDALRLQRLRTSAPAPWAADATSAGPAWDAAQAGAPCDYWRGHALLPSGGQVKYKYVVQKQGCNGGGRW